MDRRRVVVTGLGVVTPIGIGVDRMWAALMAGTSGVGPLTRFDPKDMPTRIAAEVKEFNAEDWMEKREVKKMARFIHFALAAAQMAARQAGLKDGTALGEGAGAIVGVGMGGLDVIEHYHDVLREEGVRRITPFFIPMLIANMAAGQIAIRFGAKGPNVCTTTACASGAHALGDAFRLLQRGEVELMFAGGAESVITPLGVAGFNALRALSTRNDDPQHASRPFDRDRDGFVMGEGAGILVLETLEAAQRRGAVPLAEVLGYGENGDAYHMTAPAPGHEGAVRCMRLALRDAQMRPDQIDYLNAHGTSTEANDREETQAIKTVFGEAAAKLPVSSTKSMTGHLLGAAGGVEAAISVLAIQHGRIPPTINYEHPDPACDLDYVPNQARAVPIRHVMSNSFGFGGTNAVLVFGPAPPSP